MFDAFQYRILTRIAPREQDTMTASTYDTKSKIRVLLGDELLRYVAGKTVIDFGCGEGEPSLDLARAGAVKVIGLDIREDSLQKARTRAVSAGLSEVCEFACTTDVKADVIVSLDAFEHFSDPAGILRLMHSLLKPGGFVVASFGPTWYHPLGGHLFSVFPWSHLVFSEAALLRWRADLRDDGATRFSEVDGGLNQMTIARFEHIASESPFHLDLLEQIPIRSLQFLHCRLTREFTTAIVRAKLVPKLST